jgi:hypothetical protein
MSSAVQSGNDTRPPGVEAALRQLLQCEPLQAALGRVATIPEIGARTLLDQCWTPHGVHRAQHRLDAETHVFLMTNSNEAGGMNRAARFKDWARADAAADAALQRTPAQFPTESGCPAPGPIRLWLAPS